MTDDVEIGPDYEPDETGELLHDHEGLPLTQRALDEMAREIEEDDSRVDPDTVVVVRSVRRGRPSLSGGGRRSPRLSVRLDEASHRKLVRRAHEQGVTKSELIQRAVREYLERV